MDYSKKSGEYFSNGYCCAESVLLGISEAKNLQSDLIPKIATGFCTGIAKTDSLCGALVGGILGINIFTGRNIAGADRTKNYELIQNLVNIFKKEFGVTACTEVCGCNLSTLSGQEKFAESEAKSICLKAVERTTEIVLQLLDENHTNL